MAEDAQLPPAEREAPAKRLDRFERPFQFSLGKLMLWVAAFALLCGLLTSLWRAIEGAREAARRTGCVCHLKQLACALHCYLDAHGCFPPAYFCDKNGKPMHSWRVLILPHFNEEAAYARYDFTMPWNSPQNQRVANAVWGRNADYFQCPSGRLHGTPFTNYVAVVGPDTVLLKDKSRKLTSGNAQKIMLVEIADSDIHWMEPRDLTFDQVMALARGGSGATASSRHPAGVNYADASSTVRTLDRDVDVKTLRKMLIVEPADSGMCGESAVAENIQSGQTQP